MAECAIEDCTRTAVARGWCNMHVKRWRKHGSVMADVPPMRSPRGDSCTVGGCSKPQKGRGLCEMHLQRFRKHGDVNRVHVGNLKEVPSYTGAHMRMRTQLGSASKRACVDCGNPAREWSYRGGDPDEMVDERLGCIYSLDFDFYEPRCKKCHIAFDDVMARAWETRHRS